MRRKFLSPSLLCRRWLIGLAVLALVATQSLGLAHGLLHAPHGARAPLSPAAWDAWAAFNADEGFGHENGSLSCQLFDLAAHADGVPAAALPLPAVARSAPVAVPPCLGQTRAAPALYDARAPPVSA